MGMGGAPMDPGMGMGGPNGGFGGAPGGPPPGASPYGAAPPADYGQQPPPYGGMGMPGPGAPMQPYGGGAPMMQPGMGPMGQMVPGAGAPPRSWMITLLMAVFGGYLGIHRFYTGHTLYGVLQLVTCGGFGVWQWIDIIFILMGKYTDAQGRPLVKDS
jgi:hypothetical protein